MNRIGSSRRLEREAQRNVELMWLTGRLAPFAAGTNPRGLAIDQRGTLLYCTSYGANSVSAYRINPIAGFLNEIRGSPYSTGDGPFGIAIF